MFKWNGTGSVRSVPHLSRPSGGRVAQTFVRWDVKRTQHTFMLYAVVVARPYDSKISICTLVAPTILFCASTNNVYFEYKGSFGVRSIAYYITCVSRTIRRALYYDACESTQCF